MFVKKFIGISSPKLPTFAGELTSSEIEPCLVGHYGIPKASTKIAFDSTQGILAVATRALFLVQLIKANNSEINDLHLFEAKTFPSGTIALQQSKYKIQQSQ